MTSQNRQLESGGKIVTAIIVAAIIVAAIIVTPLLLPLFCLLLLVDVAAVVVY